MSVAFTRVLKRGDVGPDVEAVGRALARRYGYLTEFNNQKVSVRRTWGDGKIRSLQKLIAETRRAPHESYTQTDHKYLETSFDQKAWHLYMSYVPPPALYFPIVEGGYGRVCQGLHETAGIPVNWAIDFCAAAGAGIVAPEAGWIERLSGKDPDLDTPDPTGAYGWSVYVMTRAGYRYYATHLGWRPPELAVGLRVAAGELIGKVGDQEFRPDHVHLGVTSPYGPSDAKRRISKVSVAPKIH